MNDLTLPARPMWTPERTEHLKTRWADGATAARIAVELGGGTTRNAVIGKIARLKLTRHPMQNRKRRPAKAKGQKGQKGQPKVNAIINAVRARRKAPTPPPMEPEPFDPETDMGNDVGHLIGIMDLTPHTCRYPSGDPLLPTFGYCGQHTDKGPYCPAHTRRAYIGGRP